MNATTKTWNEAAAPTQRSGWGCLTCGRFYDGDDAERLARYCCAADRPCDGCGKLTESKHRVRCNVCREKYWKKRYLDLPAEEWDGKQMLAVYDDDRYFHDVDELLEYIAEADNLDDVCELTQEMVDRHRIVLCEPHSPGGWDLRDQFADYLGEDQEPPGNWEAVERIVNEYIKAHLVWSWMPADKRLKVS